jgi:hypothetical protein
MNPSVLIWSDLSVFGVLKRAAGITADKLLFVSAVKLMFLDCDISERSTFHRMSLEAFILDSLLDRDAQGVESRPKRWLPRVFVRGLLVTTA